MGFAPSSMQLTSPAFKPLGRIPKKHTGEAEDVSPVLEWKDAPAGTKAFALVVHDPDAPLITPVMYGFVHWVLYNIPPSVTSLAEGTGEHTQGLKGTGQPGYMGPMPPPGQGRTDTNPCSPRAGPP